MATSIHDPRDKAMLGWVEEVSGGRLRLHVTAEGVARGRFRPEDDGRILNGPEEMAAVLGAVEVIGGRIETFTNSIFGTFDVAKAWRLVRGKPGKHRPQRFPLMAEYIDYIEAEVEIDEAKALALPSKALEKPVLGIWIEGKVLTLDGHHRIWARWQLGFRDFEQIVLPESLIDRIRIAR